MNVIRKDDSQERPNTAPLMVGDVRSRMLVSPEMSEAVTVNLVRFLNGARNRVHTHSTDQILFVTEGHGIVAAEGKEVRVSAGDVVHCPAGVPHWHGAEPGKEMAHLSILPPSATVVIEEP